MIGVSSGMSTLYKFGDHQHRDITYLICLVTSNNNVSKSHVNLWMGVSSGMSTPYKFGDHQHRDMEI